MILSTVCYLIQDNKVLMLHRNKKENDINEGKWIGVGGKIESGESPEECIIREVYEETGLTIKEPKLKAYITFPKLYYGQDEGMFLFTCHSFSGTLTECNEGTLAWIEKDQLLSLPLWQGDKYFFQWIEQDDFFSAKMTYKENQLIDCQIHHYK